MAHRPNILALASKISLESLTYTGITYGDPEYRILDPIVDDDMCSVMMRMRLETDFSAEDLAENCTAIIKAIIKAKPASAKGVYIQSCTLSATMTPGVKVETRDIAKEMA